MELLLEGHAAWQPGQSRGSVPFNFGPAVKLSGIEAEVVGVYSFPPAQPGLMQRQCRPPVRCVRAYALSERRSQTD